MVEQLGEKGINKLMNAFLNNGTPDPSDEDGGEESGGNFGGFLSSIISGGGGSTSAILGTIFSCIGGQNPSIQDRLISLFAEKTLGAGNSGVYGTIIDYFLSNKDDPLVLSFLKKLLNMKLQQQEDSDKSGVISGVISNLVLDPGSADLESQLRDTLIGNTAGRFTGGNNE